MDAEEFMGMMSSDPEEKPRPLHEAQIMELRDLYGRYQAGAERFTPGDLVMAVQGGELTRPGEPCIVVEVRPEAEADFSCGESGSHDNGSRHDIRIARYASGPASGYVCFWAQSWNFVPYTPPSGGAA